MLQVSDSEIKNRLHFDNPWWQKGEDIDLRIAEMPVRDYFPAFFEQVDNWQVRRAVVLMGPRRVGKTVMAYQAIKQLLGQGVEGARILYLSLETPIYTGLRLDQLVTAFQELHGHDRKTGLYLFFDEIQYLKDWELHLKSLVDSYPGYRIVVTGSAAAALRLKSRESGAGRFTEFALPPLTFSEFLHFLGREGLPGQAKQNDREAMETLNQSFIDYLNWGGYPEAVFSEAIRSNSQRFIKSDIIDKVLMRDLPSLYGISDIQELNRLFTVLAYNTSQEVSLDELSKSSGVAKNTIRRYLEYLEAAFLIRRVYRVDQNAKRFKRAVTFKVYLANPSMRSALFGPVTGDSEAMGAIAETGVFAQLLHDDVHAPFHYARWKSGEVDLVGMSPEGHVFWAFEIKWSDTAVNSRNACKSLVQFLQDRLERSRVVMTTRTRHGTVRQEGMDIELMPVSHLAFLLGKTTLPTLMQHSR